MLKSSRLFLEIFLKLLHNYNEIYKNKPLKIRIFYEDFTTHARHWRYNGLF